MKISLTVLALPVRPATETPRSRRIGRGCTNNIVSFFARVSQ